MSLEITKAQARKFLLHKQLLFPPRSFSNKKDIEKVFNTLRLIQYDPLKPCGRNVDLVLQARIKNYHPDEYYHWLYKEKKGIECYDKELCIVPIEDFPLTNIRRGLAQKHVGNKKFLQKYERQIEELLQQIAKNGLISSADIIDTKRVKSGWGTDATFGRIALETLWEIGRVVVVKRENGRKYYDLPSRVHSSLVVDKLSNESITKEHVKRRLQSVGLLPLSGGGGGWQGLGSVRAVITQLIKDHEFVEVKITGISRSYVIAKQDEQLLYDISSMRLKKKVIFLAPLDNLMWDRQMILELFNFHYRWEVYTPVVKRQYGYYVLPILYGDTFIGRIEPVFTKTGRLEIKGFWQEDKKMWNEKTIRAFEKSLTLFTKYLQAKEIINAPYWK